MNEIQRSCAMVFRQGLELKGWKALDECTLVKNYCVFKMYDNNSPAKVGYVLPQYGWTLTREYVPLRAGKISTAVANIQLNAAEKGDVDEVLSDIKVLETYAKMPRYLQFANRMRKTPVTSVVTVLHPVEAKSGDKARWVRVEKKFDSAFKVGEYYEVAAMNAQKSKTPDGQEIPEGVGLYRYNARTKQRNGRMFLYTDVRGFYEAMQRGDLQLIIFEEVPETKESFNYTNVDVAEYHVPKGLLEKTNSDFVKGAIVQLFQKNRNFTPLLCAKYDSNAVDDVCAYLMENNVNADFTGRFLSEGSIALLRRFGSIGFNEKFILDNADDEDKIQSTINYVVSLSEPPYNVSRDYIRALYPLVGSFDPMHLPEASSADLLYLALKYGSTLPDLVRVFSSLGVKTENGVEVMPAHMTSGFLNGIRRVFAMDYPLADSEIKWSNALEGILRNAVCIGFSIKDGFYVSFYHYKLKRDYNSVFVEDKNGVCWWRGTCVDGKVYCDSGALLSFGVV